MTVSARWQGRVIFADRYAVFEGQTGDNRLHSHAAAQVVIGNNCCVQLGDGTQFCGSALLIRPHVRHRLLPQADLKVILIEPASDLGAALLTGLSDRAVVILNDGGRQVEALCTARLAYSLDQRLVDATALLSRSSHNDLTLAEVAAAVGLSPVRLRSIAARQLGMPLARWRRWASLRRACVAITEGAAPADAAFAGGFSDQAHLTRTMRSMLGITPASLHRALS